MTVTLTNAQFEQMRKMQKAHNELQKKLEAIGNVVIAMKNEVEDEILIHFYKRKINKILDGSEFKDDCEK